MPSSSQACTTAHRDTDIRPHRGEQTLLQLTIAVALMTVLAACEGAEPVSTEVPASPTPIIKVAFVRDLSVPDADEHALPAMQAVRLAFETATLLDPTAAPIVARMDTGWRETVEKLARHIAGDPDET